MQDCKEPLNPTRTQLEQEQRCHAPFVVVQPDHETFMESALEQHEQHVPYCPIFFPFYKDQNLRRCSIIALSRMPGRRIWYWNYIYSNYAFHEVLRADTALQHCEMSVLTLPEPRLSLFYATLAATSIANEIGTHTPMRTL